MKLNNSTNSIISIFVLIVAALCAYSLQGENADDNAAQLELHAPKPDIWEVHWGKDTNGIKAGISIGYYSNQSFQYFSKNPNEVTIRCFPLLENIATNDPKPLTIDLPSVESRYLMELKDEKGYLVERTARGKALGKHNPEMYKTSSRFGVTLDTGWRPARYMLLQNQICSQIQPFLLQEYFKITNSGLYHLHFEMYAFKLGANTDTEELIKLPPIDAKIKIQLNNTGKD